MSKPWIGKREGWIKKNERRTSNVQRPTSNDKPKKVYSVTEVAELLSVHKQTIMKWLEFDEDDPEGGVIPSSAWFKLPNGHIRIKEWIVLKIMKG